jgi:hypothetical protein
MKRVFDLSLTVATIPIWLPLMGILAFLVRIKRAEKLKAES